MTRYPDPTPAQLDAVASNVTHIRAQAAMLSHQAGMSDTEALRSAYRNLNMFGTFDRIIDDFNAATSHLTEKDN